MEFSAQFPVKHLCDVLDINRSGLYKWKKRLEHPSERLKTYVSNLMLFKEYHAKYPSQGYRWLNAKIRLDTGPYNQCLKTQNSVYFLLTTVFNVLDITK